MQDAHDLLFIVDTLADLDHLREVFHEAAVRPFRGFAWADPAPLGRVQVTGFEMGLGTRERGDDAAQVREHGHVIDRSRSWETPVLPPTQLPVASGWSSLSVSTSALTAVAIERSRCRMLARSSWYLMSRVKRLSEIRKRSSMRSPASLSLLLE